MSEATFDPNIVAQVADDLPVGVWVATVPSGELVYANRRFAEIMGLRARDDVAVGEYAEPYGIFGTDEQPYPEDQMPFVRAVRARKTVVIDDIVIHRGDGVRVNIRAHARPVFDAEGHIVQVVIAFSDWTGEAMSVQALRDTSRRLEQTNRELEQVIYAASHDLRTPLVGIEGFSHEIVAVGEEIVAEARAGGDAAALIARIEEELLPMARRTQAGAQRLDNMLGALLRVSRAGRSPTRWETVDVDLMVREILEDLHPRIDASGAEFSVELLPPCRGDAAGVRRVFANLLTNVLKYRRPDRPCRARVLAEQVAGRVRYTVADNGVGIPYSQRERVFQLFRRLSPESVAGDGLGLAIARRIVEAHDGEIRVEEGIDGGAAFVVELPTARSGGRRDRETMPLPIVSRP